MQTTDVKMEDETGYHPPAVRVFRAAIASFLVHMLLALILAACFWVVSISTTGVDEFTPLGDVALLTALAAGCSAPLVELGVLI